MDKNKLVPLETNMPDAFGYPDFRNLKDVMVIPFEEEPVKEVVSTPTDEVFRQIYALNPNTSHHQS